MAQGGEEFFGDVLVLDAEDVQNRLLVDKAVAAGVHELAVGFHVVLYERIRHLQALVLVDLNEAMGHAVLLDLLGPDFVGLDLELLDDFFLHLVTCDLVCVADAFILYFDAIGLLLLNECQVEVLANCAFELIHDVDLELQVHLLVEFAIFID